MTVRLERDPRSQGRIATLILDDAPRKNAMTAAMGEALEARVAELLADANVRVVVLRGAGGAFSGGGDLAMLEHLRTVTPEESRAFMLAFYAKYLSLTTLAVPTIAVVEGAAIGAGLCVALACDLLLVDEKAKLAVNFASLGLHPGMGATYLVPRRAGAMRGAELLLTGRRFDGQAAVDYGLALSAHPVDKLLVEADALAKHLAESAPLVVRALKKRLGVDADALTQALEYEASEQAISYASADLGEGLAAARGRRPATFAGA
jgi:enoyl-CoA hydratase/carnithine racemase